MYPLTPWVKRLLVANVAMFLVTQALPRPLVDELVFYPLRPYPELGVYRPDLFYKPWTVVTYMFLHAGLGHIFFNMIGLFFFGPRLEHRLGGADFLKLYFLSGLGGAVFSFFFAQANPIVGASGAVFGVLLGFAMFWPREELLIFPLPVPIKAWVMVTLWGLFSLWQGFSATDSGIAHFAHLGGLAFAFGYLKLRDWRQGSARREFQKKVDAAYGGGGGGLAGDRSALKRWEGIDVQGLHELNRDEVRTLLERARDDGVKSLSQEERQFLDRMAQATGS